MTKKKFSFLSFVMRMHDGNIFVCGKSIYNVLIVCFVNSCIDHAFLWILFFKLKAKMSQPYIIICNVSMAILILCILFYVGIIPEGTYIYI